MAGGDCDYIKSVSNPILHFLFLGVIYLLQKNRPLKTMITDHKNKITKVGDVLKYCSGNVFTESKAVKWLFIAYS